MFILLLVDSHTHSKNLNIGYKCQVWDFGQCSKQFPKIVYLTTKNLSHSINGQKYDKTLDISLLNTGKLSKILPRILKFQKSKRYLLSGMRIEIVSSH